MKTIYFSKLGAILDLCAKKVIGAFQTFLIGVLCAIIYAYWVFAKAVYIVILLLVVLTAKVFWISMVILNMLGLMKIKR